MKAVEIKAQPPAEISTNAWLKEIAWQLAILNEYQLVSHQEFHVIPLETQVGIDAEIVPKRKPGRPRKVKNV